MSELSNFDELEVEELVVTAIEQRRTLWFRDRLPKESRMLFAIQLRDEVPGSACSGGVIIIGIYMSM